MDQQVTEYIAAGEPWQAEVAEKIRARIFEIAPDITERIQYKKPHYLKGTHYAAVLTYAKGKVSLMLFNAKEIPEEKGFLRAMGDGDRKTIDITEGQDVDYDRIATLFATTSAGL